MKPFGYHGFVALNSSKKNHAKLTALSHRIQGGKAMKGSIPRQFIDDLLTKSNIVDVINARVKLKKADEIIKLVVRFITKKHHPSR